MKITVDAVGLSLTPQIRAYVEYRMFSATCRFGRSAKRLSVKLDERETARPGAMYRCLAVLDLMPTGQIQVSAADDRLYGAIDAAAERLARDGDRHFIVKSREVGWGCESARTH